MDILLLLLQFISVLAGFVLAWVIYQIIRLVLNFFRSRAERNDQKRFMVLRLSDRVVGVLCAISFLALVL